MSEKLDPEAKRLRNVSSGELADAIGALEARVEVLKAEAIRREPNSLRRLWCSKVAEAPRSAVGKSSALTPEAAALVWRARASAAARSRF
jgi:hypothetical protein